MFCFYVLFSSKVTEQGPNITVPLLLGTQELTWQSFLVTKARSRLESYHWSLGPPLPPLLALPLGDTNTVEQMTRVGSHPRTFAGTTDCRPEVFWLGWCLRFSSGNLQSTFSQERDQNVRVRAPCRPQVNFSMFRELCGCCPQQRGPAVFVESSLLS